MARNEIKVKGQRPALGLSVSQLPWSQSAGICLISEQGVQASLLFKCWKPNQCSNSTLPQQKSPKNLAQSSGSFVQR